MEAMGAGGGEGLAERAGEREKPQEAKARWSRATIFQTEARAHNAKRQERNE